jgi:rare lipoprotein A
LRTWWPSPKNEGNHYREANTHPLCRRVFLFNRVDRASSVTQAQSGIASVYSGGRTASGEIASARGMTAAHRTLPFGTLVRVTNQRSGRSVVVRINDRGPFVRGRVIDVTPAAARLLGFSGLTLVTLGVIDHRG